MLVQKLKTGIASSSLSEVNKIFAQYQSRKESLKLLMMLQIGKNFRSLLRTKKEFAKNLYDHLATWITSVFLLLTSQYCH